MIGELKQIGVFTIPIAISAVEGQDWVTLEALVDTGASICALPTSLLQRLDVRPMAKYEFEFGQGEVRQMDIGQMWVRVEDRAIITQVMFNDEGTEPLLGAMALEGTFLGADPVRQELVPIRGRS